MAQHVTQQACKILSAMLNTRRALVGRQVQKTTITNITTNRKNVTVVMMGRQEGLDTDDVVWHRVQVSLVIILNPELADATLHTLKVFASHGQQCVAILVVTADGIRGYKELAATR